jgi:ribonuclease J
MSKSHRRPLEPTELVFAPLGGVGEIGMNLSLYGLGDGRRREWLIVDFGVSFGGEREPGIDLVMPDIRFLEGERQNIAGLVLTHVHEDHYGALFDLWPRLRVPVWCTPFAAAMIASKREAERGAPDIDVHVFAPGARFKVGAFDIDTIDVAHSIPESVALAIRTPLGNVLHTGDWKLDPTPVVGKPTDEAKLRAFGMEGVRALVCDSTNAVREGRSPSEADVAVTLAEVIAGATGRVAVTTFASNVARIRSIALAAEKAGRHVIVVGRAMERVVGIARELGMLDEVAPFLGTDAYDRLPRAKVLALCTGSQGEPRAALARIAEDQHPDVTLSQGDTVIMSCRTIPGNEKPVGRVINGLIRQGISVITDRTHLVHVSGHPRRAELAELYDWVKPELAIPVHGEPLHLSEHAGLARKLGVPEVLTCANGDLVALSPGPAAIIDEVPAGLIYKDGRLLVEAAARTVPERLRLAFAGVISVAVAVSDKGELAAEPSVELSGIPETDADGEFLETIARDTVLDTFGALPKARRRDPDGLAETLTRALRGAIGEAWAKKPTCHVHVLVV